MVFVALIWRDWLLGLLLGLLMWGMLLGISRPQASFKTFPKDLVVTELKALPEPDPALFRELDRLIKVTHKVTPQDHLWNLAKKYGTTWDSLRSSNLLESTLLSVGQTLVIHNHKGLLHSVKSVQGKPETLSMIAKTFNTTPEEIVKASELPPVYLLEDSLEVDQKIFVPNATIRFPDFLFPFTGRVRISSGFSYRLRKSSQGFTRGLGQFCRLEGRIRKFGDPQPS